MSPDEPTLPADASPSPAPPPPPRRRRRWLRWTLGLLLALVLLLVLAAGLGWYAVSSESGTRMVLTRLRGMIPGELTVGRQKGPLTGPLELWDVHYRNDSMDVRVRRLYLAWDAGKLRRRQVDVRQLQAEGIRVVLAPSKEEETKDGRLVDVHLPVNIIVRDALVRNVEIVRPGQPPFRLDRIALNAESERARDVVHVRDLAVDGPTFKLRAAGDLTPVGAYGVSLQARATYDDPQMPPFVVAGRFNGTLEKLGVDATLTQPFDARVRGSVLTPMRELGMDLAARVSGFNAREINPEWPVARITRGDVTIKGQLNDFTSQGRVVGAYESYGAGEADYRLARRGDDFFFEYLNLKTASGAAVDARGTLTLAQPAADSRLDIVAQARGIDLQAINREWPLARIRSADVAIRGKLTEFSSEGKVSGSYEDFGAGVVDYKMARRGDDFSFESVRLRTGPGGVLDAHGRASLAKQGRMDVTANWRRLSWPLQGAAPAVVSPAGKARVRGRLDDYLLDLDAQLAGPSIPPGHWVLAGRGNQRRMDLRSLRGDLLRGRLAAVGTVSWKPAIAWRLRVNGAGIDPGARFAAWPGRIHFAAASQGTLRNGAPYGRVDLDQLGGQLRGNELDGRVHLELLGNRYRLPRLDLRSGTARLTAAGSFSKTAGNLDWRLVAPNLAEALPDGTGSVTAQGNLAGPWTSPRVRAQANGQGLAFRTYDAEGLTLVADVDLARDGPVLIDLDATGVGVGERRFETVTLDGRGRRAAHEVALAVRAKEGSFDLTLAGGLRGNTDWNGEIRRLDLANEQTGTWRLAGPAGLAASPERAALRGFCWTSTDRNNARLCADGQWSKTGPWNANATIADLPFALFKPFLPPDLEITGATQGTVTASGSARGFVTANVDLRPGPGEVRYPRSDGKTAAVRFDQGTVRVLAGADGLTGHADLTFIDTGIVRADLRLPQYNTIGAPLQSQSLGGRIVADFTNLSLVEAFVPDATNTRGTLTADLALGGTVAKPVVTGGAELAQAQVDVPRYGLQVRQIQLTARAAGPGPIQIQGSARSGQGTVTLTGAAAVDGSPSRLTLEGRRFQAANTRDLKVVVSPRIELAMTGNRIDVTGDVEVPEAEINQEKRRRATVGISQDVVILPPSAEGAVTPGAAPRELHARLRVILGDKIKVKALGFSGEPSGSLLVIEEPNKATAGVGELVVKNGVYKSYGQDLTLDRGRLIFAGGPIDNPGLDLRAYRKADDGTVAGLNIRGTLRSPQATLYSDPPMGESEALAYLLLGHPLGQASPQEGDLLANAANSLGLKGGNLLAKKMAARFGLEEARIESTGGLKEASVVVGKYLSPRLYVTYGLGLFEPVSTFRIRYLLGREWSLQAEQGTETGADLLYTVERGKGGETPAPVRDKGEDVKAPAGTGDTGGTGGGSRR